jgi:hypothetical protein
MNIVNAQELAKNFTALAIENHLISVENGENAIKSSKLVADFYNNLVELLASPNNEK